MRPATFAVLTILAVPPVAPADPPPPDVRPLIAALGSPAYRDREQAARRLAVVGDRALPALKSALLTTADPEVARRLEVLIRRIDADRLTGPRTVTLRAKNVTAKAALAELAKASGYALQADGIGDEQTRYSFDLVDVPFWKAVDAVSDAAGLAPNHVDDSGTLGFYQNDTFNPHVAYSGPFRLVATNLGTSQTIQLGGLPRGRPFGRLPESLNLNFQVYAEPRAPLIGSGQPTVVTATDDTGASMVPVAEPGQSQSYYPPQQSYRTFNLGAGVNLTRPVKAAAEVRQLTARVPLLVLSESRPDAVIPNPLAAKGKRFAGRSMDVEVTSAVSEKESAAVGLLVTCRDGTPDDYSWMNGITQRFEAYDAKGNRLPPASVDQNNTGPNACTLTLSFQRDDDKPFARPAKLVLVEWVAVTKEVEFTFKGLPLP